MELHGFSVVRRQCCRVLFVALAWVLPVTASAAPEGGPWALLLQAHVVQINDSATQVDYAGFARDREQLKTFLASLSKASQAEFDGWQRNDQLAFLINAYNAWTVELILTGYPNLDSIRDLGSLFRSPWRKAFIPLLGKTRSLDEIEHELIRGTGGYNEPRIHFAVNCASIGCPALRAEPYVGDQLDFQLTDQTRRFMQDTSRNRLTDKGLQLSAIFKWYREDFERGWGGYERLEDFLADHADALQLSADNLRQLRAGDLDIAFLDYDWDLNDVR